MCAPGAGRIASRGPPQVRVRLLTRPPAAAEPDLEPAGSSLEGRNGRPRVGLEQVLYVGRATHGFRSKAVDRGSLVQLPRGGRIRLVGDSAEADYVVSGRVEFLTTESRSFSSSVRALEFTVSMQLQLAVQARGGRDLLLDPFALRESEIYLASADIEISAKNRAEALRRLSGLLASRIRDALELSAEREHVLESASE